MDTAISIHNIHKKFRLYHEKRSSIQEHLTSFFSRSRYEDLNVLADISVDIRKGDMFGILGRNGAGKTTLLRLIAGIYKPDSGSITVNGTMISLLRLGVGFNGELTARENVSQYGTLLGFSKQYLRENTDEIIEYAEVEKFAGTKLKNFSPGMKVRLAFSIAVRVDPDIILVDETLAVGDGGFKKKSYEEFMSFREKKKTIVYVTHNLGEVLKNCTRAMLLNEGRVAALGEPEMVVKRYEELFE